jgi:hypothetical protein
MPKAEYSINSSPPRKLHSWSGAYTLLLVTSVVAYYEGPKVALSWLSYIGTRLRFVEWLVLALDGMVTFIGHDLEKLDHVPNTQHINWKRELEHVFFKSVRWFTRVVYFESVKMPILAALSIAIIYALNIPAFFASNAHLFGGPLNYWLGLQESVSLALGVLVFSGLYQTIKKLEGPNHLLSDALTTTWFAEVNKYLSATMVLRFVGLTILVMEGAAYCAVANVTSMGVGVYLELRLRDYKNRMHYTLTTEKGFLDAIGKLLPTAGKSAPIRYQQISQKVPQNQVVAQLPFTTFNLFKLAFHTYAFESLGGLATSYYFAGEIKPFTVWGVVWAVIGNGLNNYFKEDRGLQALAQEVCKLRTNTGCQNMTTSELEGYVKLLNDRMHTRRCPDISLPVVGKGPSKTSYVKHVATTFVGGAYNGGLGTPESKPTRVDCALLGIVPWPSECCAAMPNSPQGEPETHAGREVERVLFTTRNATVML